MCKTIIQIITIYRINVVFFVSEGPEDNFISEIKFIDENTVLCCSEKSGEIIHKTTFSPHITVNKLLE